MKDGNYIVEDIVIPEFPLPTDTTDNMEKGAYSNCVDFVLFSEDKRNQKKYVWLIELKTDIQSIRQNQIDYLVNAYGKDFRQIIEDVKRVVNKSGQRQKYFYLFKYLNEEKIVEIPCGIEKLRTHTFVPFKSKGELCYRSSKEFIALINTIKTKWTPAEIKVLFIIPKTTDRIQQQLNGYNKELKKEYNFDYVDFERVIKYIDKPKDKDLTKILHEYLITWIKPPRSPDNKTAV